ncbi:Asp-tRNAAsn/Glu-tRNAGln amidotransferase A subunit [Sanguibacter gelidistatuariae]|uniref:Asp-tRNAAsn/Glu-tRNAGln amidotransferase A subunit n=1 Tax=Sanguibacter gelidistatuariae TaxID=1814289 RepID=A0A1G6GRQ9_9MICO|nr:AtzH-like domain-containing protein [Sanguibacter gelidistatuariae]SDB84680.1 Asp-tRNAAsn/Glu-tRNAGln amidotransferase A subunit [Sanguibacter gelidistatuariae]
MPAPHTQLLRAFWRYEQALMTNDVVALDDLFADSPATIRSDGGTTLVGHEQIAAFRAGRPPVAARRLTRVHVREVDPATAVIVAESVRADGGTGAQTQLWSRGLLGAWQVNTAHVSLAPAPAAPRLPDDADLTSIWRVTVDDAATPFPKSPFPEPLVPVGPLNGLTVAVKDLFAVAGQQVGAGNPAWLAAAPVEATSAWAVTALLAGGARIAGIAQTDELAFSLAGTNIHYGTPPNAAAPGTITGGSTSGPAAAVAAGLADVALGTDTAGSVRVPASYCGLYGLRTTHDAVPRGGLVPLAPSFDTVGVLTRTAGHLAAAADALLPAQDVVPVTRIAVVPALMDLAEPAVQKAVEAALLALALRSEATVETVTEIGPGALEAWFTAFRTVQQAEGWAVHGAFVASHPGAFEPAVEARFHAGAQITAAEHEAASAVLEQARATLRALVPPGTVLALPSTSSPAPRVDAGAVEIDFTRAATLRLTCLASLAGLPALSVPTPRVGTAPVGLCLVGGPGQDRTLVELVTGGSL